MLFNCLGKSRKISNVKDKSLSSSLFFLDLINSIKPGIVDSNLVKPGNDIKEQKLNANYAISLARKLGATIFILPEDILEIQPKMVP